MVTFRVTREIRAPPRFVSDWWWDFSPTDRTITPGMVRREVKKLDERTVRLTTESQFGGQIRTTAGTVTRTGPDSWHITGHVFSGGKVVSTLQTHYTVEPTVDGSRLRADFEFVGRTLPWKIALALSGFSLRRDRRKMFEGYARAIEEEFVGSSSGDGPGAPRSQVRPGSSPPV
jgi:hypothetical protein